MPPSPSLRRFPGREPRKGLPHRRVGHSFESGLLHKAKDDDLVLFNEMQKHERDKFLLHMSDDFDDSILKLKHISDFKLWITIPSRGENRDLLYTDGDKNDYDWLLTPPDTPLFPTLDYDESQPVKTSRGRTRSQLISVSKPDMNERTQRTSRSSASPQSIYGVNQEAARPSLVPRSSSPPVTRQRNPSRRHSTPPAKPSTPTPRSSTPTFRRTSTGACGRAFSSSRRVTSPVKANREYSASPKSRRWQSNLPGFSMDAPPNLRTSLLDQSASHACGSFPASRNSADSSSKFESQPISPSATRSANLLHSHERHQFASCSKASAASFSKDDKGSLLSIAVGVSDSSTVRKYDSSANSRGITFYKKASRLPSASSSPIISFDSADYQKTPHNIFRPLLSSVRTTTCYAGKTNSAPGTMSSVNLSDSTGGNSFSESGLNFDLDMENHGHGQSDLAGEWENFDVFDVISEDNGHGAHAEKLQHGTKDFDEHMEKELDLQRLQSSSGDTDVASTAPALQSSHITECSEISGNSIFITCSKWGKHILTMDLDGYRDVCQECGGIDELLDSREQGASLHKTGKYSSDSKAHLQIGVNEVPENNCSEQMLGHYERSSEQVADSVPDNSSSQSAMGVGDDHHVTDSLKDTGDWHLFKRLTDYLNDENAQEATGGESGDIPDNLNEENDQEATVGESGDIPQQSYLTADPSVAFDNPEDTCISVLQMQRSSSSKCPVLERASFSSTSLICSEPSYEKDNLSWMKCSIDSENSSSSSIYLGSSRQSNVASRNVLFQLRGRGDEVSNMRNSCNMNVESTYSHSEASVNVKESSTLSSSQTEIVEDILEILIETDMHENANKDTLVSIENTSMESDVMVQDISVCTGASVASDISYSQLLGPELCFQLHNKPVADNLNNETCILSEEANEVFSQNDRTGILRVEIGIPVNTPNLSCIENNHMLNRIGCQYKILGAATNSSSNLILEQKLDHCFQESQNELAHAEMPNCMDDFQEGFVLTTSDKDVLVSASESNCSENPPCNGTVAAPRGSTQRTFTLEEATDTILFCCSIIHDVTYKAAIIGMEKEMARSYQNVERKEVEIDTKKLLIDLGNNVRIPEVVSSNSEVSQTVASVKPLTLRSKCNCTVM